MNLWHWDIAVTFDCPDVEGAGLGVSLVPTSSWEGSLLSGLGSSIESIIPRRRGEIGKLVVHGRGIEAAGQDIECAEGYVWEVRHLEVGWQGAKDQHAFVCSKV